MTTTQTAPTRTTADVAAELRSFRAELAADLTRLDAAIAELEPPPAALTLERDAIDARADAARDAMLKVTARREWQAASVAKATGMAPTTAGRAIRRLLDRRAVRQVGTTKTGAPIVAVER